MLDLMELGPEAVLVIHVGGIYGDRDASLTRWRTLGSSCQCTFSAALYSSTTTCASARRTFCGYMSRPRSVLSSILSLLVPEP
jgi:hypothetical protein